MSSNHKSQQKFIVQWTVRRICFAGKEKADYTRMHNIVLVGERTLHNGIFCKNIEIYEKSIRRVGIFTIEHSDVWDWKVAENRGGVGSNFKSCILPWAFIQSLWNMHTSNWNQQNFLLPEGVVNISQKSTKSTRSEIRNITRPNDTLQGHIRPHRAT